MKRFMVLSPIAFAVCLTGVAAQRDKAVREVRPMTQAEQQLSESIQATRALMVGDPYTSVRTTAPGVQIFRLELRNANGAPLIGCRQVDIWLSDSASTGALTGTAADLFIASGVTGLQTIVVAKRILVLTTADGIAEAEVDCAGSHTWYPWISVGGNVYVGPALTF